MLSVRKVVVRPVAIGTSAFFLFLQAAAAPIQIRVLNAKNGERVAGQKVSVLIKGQKNATEYVTDAEGDINIDLDPSVQIWVATEWWTTCRKIRSGVDPYVPVAQVLREGVTIPNSCGHATSETIKGRLVIFAKKSSFIRLFKK
jgi:hypothetical protein